MKRQKLRCTSASRLLQGAMGVRFLCDEVLEGAIA
jgi:hypothetical protein